MPTRFIPFIESGGVLAIAGIRGGSEKSKEWRENGRKENRHNSINDIINGAKSLIASGITNPKQLGLYGFSHGGFMILTASLQAPELFEAVYAASPLTKMMHALDSELGLPDWEREYTNPRTNQELYRYTLNYSPFDLLSRVREEDLKSSLPSYFLVHAIDDQIVHPTHPYSFVAKAQEKRIRTILKVPEKGGHHLREDKADMNIFFLNELGSGF